MADERQHDGDYEAFLRTKTLIAPECGFDVSPSEISPRLFPFQREIVRWALRHGRAALLADTGLGKTIMEMEWAAHVADRTKGRVLSLAPLAVCRQTENSAPGFGYEVKYCRDQAESDDWGGPVVLTNYERMVNFDASRFSGVAPDESSVLKSMSSSTRQELITRFAETPYRLPATATPAPNDITEIANHAEFLGVMSRVEMLASFFINPGKSDEGGNGWRLKRHAESGPFWRWMASWAMSVRRPSDLGFPDDGYDLPAMTTPLHVVDVDTAPDGRLFWGGGAVGVGEQSILRHSTMPVRVAKTVELVTGCDRQWIVWCDYNDEDEALTAAIPGAVSVKGSDSPERKAEALVAFGRGDFRVMVTKPSIAGFGLNYQQCDRMAFCGLSFSWESFYQSVRRCWRFGQMNPVEAHVVVSSAELPIWNAIRRKGADAERMASELTRHVGAYERAEIARASTRMDYQPALVMAIPSWLTQKGIAA